VWNLEEAIRAPADFRAAERIYVAIDLETTGLDNRVDRITEIAAVRFQGGRELARFETLVNPQKSIPSRIVQMTGISNAAVAQAPRLEEVAPELLAFIGSDVAAVIEHSTFDLPFLAAGGVRFHQPDYDTVELAQILLPGLASYSLSELCQALAITADSSPWEEADTWQQSQPDYFKARNGDQWHMALRDARATAQLFWRLCQFAATLPPAVHELLLESSLEANTWSYSQFFADTLSHRSYTVSAPAAANRDDALDVGVHAPASEHAAQSQGEAVMEGNGQVHPVAEEALLGYLADDGPLASLLGGHFERRPGQVAMAAQVLHAFNTGDYLLIEAGTGIGKSLAYLLPAGLFALANRCRVVVATNTIALQDQLVEKDIPQVQALLAARPPADPHLSTLPEPPALQAAVLKGRQNYLCTRRLHAWRTNHALSPIELTVLAKVLVWLALIGEGDAGDIVLNAPAERAIWLRICSDAATCTEERCGGTIRRQARPGFGAPAGDPTGGSAYLLGTRDFYWEARRQAEAAHIVVVNHALLLADLTAGGRVLPPYRNLIVDETHRLEEAATDQLTYRVEWPAVQMLLRRIAPEGDLAGQIMRVADRLGHAPALELMPAIAKQAERTARQLARFAEQLTAFAHGQESGGRGEGGYAQRLALDSAVRSQPDWSRIEVEWGAVRANLAHLVKNIEQLVHELDGARWWETEATATLFSELRDLHAHITELAHQLDDILLAPGGSRRTRVAWMEGADNSSSVTLAIAPLTVNEVLERDLLQRQRCAIFTGATLRTGSSFRYIRDRLGLWDVKIATVDSPFDYKRSTLLYLPSDVPLPNHPHYQQMVEQAIVEAATAGGGRTLVLFTSFQQLRATADAIRTPLERQGISLFQHGQSSRYRLLREYRQTEQAVLLGTRSFWEGIDLPGEELTCLLIARLPFAVPNDPLVAARSAEFEDPFQEYTVPDAVLRFRQGFGRLIRRAADRGVVVLLDSRAWRKDYGSTFLDSLPECTVRRAPLQNLGREVRGWLGRAK
jgi:DNA polymerase-3 subunit epsilon/ATP-dependent DNA helicase DinG